MLIEHQHLPGVFDPGHCRDCARGSDLLDHYHHVQRQEQILRQAHRWARQAPRHLGVVVLRGRDPVRRRRPVGRLSHLER